jgi:NAD(P)-dependent dehydrogenase (short-subunit alcohol dehydrogenase family)
LTRRRAAGAKGVITDRAMSTQKQDTAPHADSAGRLSGRVCVVTGAGTGIGRATCVRMAEEGAEVIVTSRTAANVHDTCDAVEDAAGRRPSGLQLDVADRQAVDAAMAGVAERHGRIDVLVANAGVELLHAPSIVDTTDEDWERVLHVNATGVFYSCRAALRHMPDGGAIVTVGSINALIAWEHDAAYCASKGAVLQLTRAIALDTAPRNIRANCVCPGVIKTSMAHGFVDQAGDSAAVQREYESLSPLNRLGTPREIANCILFLASDEASFVTGTALVADGGTIIRP